MTFERLLNQLSVLTWLWKKGRVSLAMPLPSPAHFWKTKPTRAHWTLCWLCHCKGPGMRLVHDIPPGHNPAGANPLPHNNLSHTDSPFSSHTVAAIQTRSTTGLEGQWRGWQRSKITPSGGTPTTTRNSTKEHSNAPGSQICPNPDTASINSNLTSECA